MAEFVIPATGAPVNNRQDLLGFPRSYAFVIGINAYPHIEADLRTAVNDAVRMAEVLQNRQGFDHVELLTDATGAQLRDLLHRLRDPQREPRIQPNDSLVFYYAGHGKAGEFDQGPAGFLLPSDTRPRLGALENDTLLPMEEVFDTLRALNCHHTLLILDCCFAGKFRYVGSKTRDALFTPFFLPLYEERFRRYKRERAWQVLASAGPDQTAADWLGERDSGEGGMHSPFAEALFQALEGAAEIKPRGRNLGDGVLTVQELFLYLWEEVEKKSREHSAFRIQYPNLFPMANHQGGQFIFFDPNNRLNFAERVERNPYRGLHAYQPGHHDLFFGRRTVTEQLLAYLPHTALILVTASSGLGKSSTIRAGLFGFLKNKTEELRKRGMADLTGYDELLEMRPGPQPFQRLTGLSADPQEKKILLIDQYEELFTECEDQQEREDFENALIRLYARAQAGNLRILLTLRSDFEWHFDHSALGKYLKKEKPEQTIEGGDFAVRWAFNSPAAGSYPSFFRYRLPPMGLDELREALVNPAWVESYDFESDELVDLILEEVGYAPGGLPLLSFTMSELYKLTDKDTRIFTLFDYQNKLGGVSGALSRKADAIYEGLPDDRHRATLRKILLRMVRLSDGEYYRRRVYYRDAGDTDFNFLSELDYPNDEDDAMVQEVLRRLEGVERNGEGEVQAGDRGLLIIRGMDELGAYIEPAHDSLINFWSRCREWIDGFGQVNLLLQRQLWQAVNEFHQQEEADKKKDVAARAPDAETNRADSFLWDSNPKLREVILGLLDPLRLLGERVTGFPGTPEKLEKMRKAKELEKAAFWLWNNDLEGDKLMQVTAMLELWEENYGTGIPQNILDTTSGKVDVEGLLDFLLRTSDHWLNQREADFILKSWQRRNERIEELKRQRDEARAHVSSLRAMELLRRDPTLALNLAYHVYRSFQSEATSAALLEATSNDYRFYRSVFQHEERVWFAAFFQDNQDGQNKQWVVTKTAGKGLLLWDPGRREPAASFLPEDGALPAKDSPAGILQRFLETGEQNQPQSFARSDAGSSDLTVVSPDKRFTLRYEAKFRRLTLSENGGQPAPPVRISLPDSAEYLASLAFAPDPDPDDPNKPAFAAGFLVGNRICVWNSRGELLESWQEASTPNLENKGEWAGRLDYYLRNGTFPLVFSPDGQSLVVGNFDHKLRFYDLKGNLEAILPVIHQETGTWFSNLCYSPDGEQLLAGIGSRVYVWPARQERIKVSEEKSGNFSGGLANVLFLPSWERGGERDQQLLVACHNGLGYHYYFSGQGFTEGPVISLPGKDRDSGPYDIVVFPGREQFAIVGDYGTVVFRLDQTGKFDHDSSLEHPQGRPRLDWSEDRRKLTLVFSSERESRVLYDYSEEPEGFISGGDFRGFEVRKGEEGQRSGLYLVDPNGLKVQKLESLSDEVEVSAVSPDGGHVIVCNKVADREDLINISLFENLLGQWKLGRFYQALPEELEGLADL